MSEIDYVTPLTERQAGKLPAHLGLQWREARKGYLHGGCTTQVWDADVRNETSGKTIALFRCTQMVLYPK